MSLFEIVSLLGSCGSSILSFLPWVVLCLIGVMVVVFLLVAATRSVHEFVGLHSPVGSGKVFPILVIFDFE